jgi:hypothetical protein
MSEYENMTTDQLKDLEEQLYDMEIDGCAVWFERDKILNELNKRNWK